MACALFLKFIAHATLYGIAWASVTSHFNLYTQECGSPLTPNRLQWGEGVVCGSLQGQDESAMFEVSGQFLSFRHSVVEDVMAAHADVHSTLLHRLQVCV